MAKEDTIEIEGKVLEIIPGGKLYQRSDDNLEAFDTRYQMYMEKTEPIIKHYREQNVLVEIDGNDTVENIFKKIDKIINE